MACSITRIPKVGPNKGKRVESKLFQKMLNLQPDSVIAEEAYKNIYSIGFIERFGDWISAPEMMGARVTEDGEPKLDIENNIPVFTDIDGNKIQALDLEVANFPEDNGKTENKSDYLRISEEGLKMVLDKLGKRMGIKYKMINDVSKKWAGKFVAGVAVINAAYARRDTAFHEMAHPFVEAIYNQNRKFFESLYRDVLNSPEGNRVIAQTRDTQPDLQGEDFRKEVVTQLLGEYAADNIDEQGRPNKKLITRIKELIKRFGDAFKRALRNKRLDPAKLKNLSLKELATIVAAGDNEIATEISDFTVDRKFVAVNGLAAQLVKDDIIYERKGVFFVQDAGFAAPEFSARKTAESLEALRKLEAAYPGMIRIEKNNSIFEYGAGEYIVTFSKDFDVAEAEEGALYQMVLDDQAEVKPVVDTIKILQDVAREEAIRLDVENNEYVGNNGTYERLTSYGKKITGKNVDIDAATSAAEAMFKYKDKETDVVKINNEEFSFDQTVKHFERNYNYARAYGKAGHKIIEKYITGNARLDRELAEIMKEKPDQKAIPANSLNWIRKGAEFFVRLSGYESGDKMTSELMLHSNLLGIATQIDGLIQKQDGSLVMVDWKTGKGFLKNTNRILKWAAASNVDIPNNRQTAAEIELVLRAMMVKEHQPDAVFNKIIVHHLDKFNQGKLPKDIDLSNILRVLEAYYKSEDKDTYRKLNERGLFNVKTFIPSERILDPVAGLELDSKDKLAHLERHLTDLTFKLENGQFRDNAHENELRRELDLVTKTVLEFRSQDKQVITQDEEIGSLKRLVSSMWNIDNKKIQAFTAMYQQQSQKVKDDIFSEKQKSQKLFKAVKDEYDKKNPLNQVVTKGTLGLRSKFDYRDLYSFAYVFKDDEGYVPGYYKKSREEYTAEYQAGKLSKAQYDLLDYLDNTWEASFNKTMNRTAYTNMRGEDISYFQALQFRDNLEGVTNQGQLDKRFLPRFQKENNEYLEDYRGLDRLTKGVFTRFKQFFTKQLTFFFEEEFSGRTLEGNEMRQVRVKGLGSHFNINTQEHTFNLEQMHNKFFANMKEKLHMDSVVMAGDALTSYYANKQAITKGREKKKYEGLYKFLDNQIVLNVLREQDIDSAGFSKKKYTVANPFYKKGASGIRGKETMTFSFYKMLLGLKNFTTGKSMWLKPIAGTFNGAIVLAFNTSRALGGSIAKRLGVDRDSIDFTLSDLGFAYAEVAKYYKDILTFNKKNNKLYNIADRYQYLPDNYDYATDNSDLVALKNPNSRFDMLFKFHAIHEEHGHLALLAAQMRRIKMQDGTSLYDNYNTDGTFMETKKGKANIRGVKKLPTGESVAVGELTSEELNKMLKVSTTIHGAYRSDEKSAMEAHAIGQFFLQFKKYLPALLIQEGQSKQNDTFLGYFKNSTKDGNMIKDSVVIKRKTVDAQGNPITIEDTVEANVMEWHASQHMGRARIILSLLKDVTNLKEAFNNLSEREKAGAAGVMARGIMYMLGTLLVQGMYDEEDFEDDRLAIRLNYLRNDMLQGFNPVEIFRTIKNPFASITHINNVFDSSIMFFAAGLTNDRNTKGDLKGQKQFVKNMPFLSVKYELDSYGLMK